jgi:hypothetical protein
MKGLLLEAPRNAPETSETRMSTRQMVITGCTFRVATRNLGQIDTAHRATTVLSRLQTYDTRSCLNAMITGAQRRGASTTERTQAAPMLPIDRAAQISIYRDWHHRHEARHLRHGHRQVHEPTRHCLIISLVLGQSLRCANGVAASRWREHGIQA